MFQILIIAALTLLSSCSSEPFIDGRRNAGTLKNFGTSNLDRVAICYNQRLNNAEQVISLAQSECSKTNRVAIFDGYEKFNCSALNPSRVYFRCSSR